MNTRWFKLGVSLGVAGADALRSVVSRLLGRPRPPVLVVLYYHGVPETARGRFAQQMEELRRIATPIEVERRDGLNGGRRYVAVTFDDAFCSVFENAIPELLSRRIPCTVFVPTGSVGGVPAWIGPQHPDSCERVASPATLCTVSAERLVSIGSHSVTHPNFARLDDTTARLELEDSKRFLEDILRRDVTTFSFPYGAYSELSLALAEQVGYRRVFTIEPVAETFHPSLFVCGRVRVDFSDSLLEFRLKVLGAYRWVASASAWKSRLTGRPQHAGV